MAIEFSIEDRRIGGDTHVVAVRGEVDLFTAPEFKQRVTAPIDAGRRYVIVDLSGTTFVDSSSLGVLIGAHRRLRRYEGTLAIVTKITLRVVPVPEATRTLVAFFDSPTHAGEAVTAITQAGVVPGAIEMMDNLAIQAAEPMANAGFPMDAGAALLVELVAREALRLVSHLKTPPRP